MKKKKELNEEKIIRVVRFILVAVSLILSIVNMIFIHSNRVSGFILGMDVVILIELNIKSYVLRRNSKVLWEELQENLIEFNKKWGTTNDETE